MRHLIAAVLLTALFAHADSKTFTKQRDAAYSEARKRSQQGDYAGAAKVVGDALKKFGAGVEDSERKSVEQVKEVYERRAQLAAESKTEPRAARALIVDLLGTSYALDQIRSDDARLAPLLANLKRIDPKAQAFFGARSIKVRIEPGPLSPAEADALAASVVTALRDLGFEAGAEGADEVVLVASRGEVIEASMLGEKGASCELKIAATWNSGGQKLMAVDLSRRGAGWSDLIDRCYTERIRDVRVNSALKFFSAWDAR